MIVHKMALRSCPNRDLIGFGAMHYDDDIKCTSMYAVSVDFFSSSTDKDYTIEHIYTCSAGMLGFPASFTNFFDPLLRSLSRKGSIQTRYFPFLVVLPGQRIVSWVISFDKRNPWFFKW